MNLKCISISFFLMLPLWMIGATKNNQELFLQAVQLQQDKKYNQALSVYEQINPKGRAVFYNMGLIYYSLNQLPYALVYLQRAQQNAPSQDYALIAQLVTATNKQLGKPDVASYWYTLLARFVSGVSLLFLQLLFLGLWYLLFLCLFSGDKKRKNILLNVIIGLLLALSTVGLFVKASLQRYNGGVVIENEVLLRAGPEMDYDAIGALTNADQVTIIKKVDNWYLIKDGSKRGWIPATSLLPINEEMSLRK